MQFNFSGMLIYGYNFYLEDEEKPLKRNVATAMKTRRSQATIKINWKQIVEEGRLRTFALRLHPASAKHQQKTPGSWMFKMKLSLITSRKKELIMVRIPGTLWMISDCAVVILKAVVLVLMEMSAWC